MNVQFRVLDFLSPYHSIHPSTSPVKNVEVVVSFMPHKCLFSDLHQPTTFVVFNVVCSIAFNIT